MAKLYKTHISVLLVLLFSLILTACQATPTENIVVSKDQDRMIETANAETDFSKDISIRDQLSTPETCFFSFSGAGEKLVINVNADVIIPNAKTIPIYRVNSAGFSETFADGVFQLFCKGTDMYAASESFTKDAIMKEILTQKQMLASGDLDNAAREGTEVYIEQLEQDYANAPDTMGSPILSVTFQTMKEYGNSYTCFEARENKAGEGGKYFLVRNDTVFKSEELDTTDGKIVAPRSQAELRCLDADICPGAELYEIREVSGEAEIDGLCTTPGEAQTLAEDILRNIGVDDMEVYSIYLMTNLPEGSEADAVYGYSVKLRRRVNWVCVNSPGYCTFVDDPSYGFQWNYETFTMGISDDGIYAFDWKAPLEISEVIVSNSSLLPFQDIMDIFKSMMCIENEPEAQIADRYKEIEF